MFQRYLVAVSSVWGLIYFLTVADAGVKVNLSLFICSESNPVKHSNFCNKISSNLTLVWPCIINNGGKEENQLDATITVYWYIQISSTCFRQQFCPSSGALNCTLHRMVCCTQYVAGRWSIDGGQFLRHQITDRQRIGYKIQAILHSLMLLKMGKIVAPKHVELNWIINKLLLLHLVGFLLYHR